VWAVRARDHSSDEQVIKSDDLISLLHAYSEALHDMESERPGDGARRQFYQHWLSILIDECDQLPQDQIPEAARLTCLTLANGIEDYALAEAIAAQGLLEASDLRSRVTYWDQLVALRQIIADRSGDSGDRHSIRAMAEEAITALRPTLREPLYATDAVAMSSVCRVFDVAARTARADGDRSASRMFFEEAASFVRRLPPDNQRQVGFSWWADQLLQEAASDRIALGDISGAIDTLHEIDEVSVKRASSGEHALLCAGSATPLAEFRTDFARAWLAQDRPWEAAEVHMAYSLAFNLANGSGSRPSRDMLEEAVGYLELILELDAELAAADAAAAAWQPEGEAHKDWTREPVRSGVLVTLALTYQRLGRNDEAAGLAGIVIAEYPQHPSASAMEDLATQ